MFANSYMGDYIIIMKFQLSTIAIKLGLSLQTTVGDCPGVMLANLLKHWERRLVDPIEERVMCHFRYHIGGRAI